MAKTWTRSPAGGYTREKTVEPQPLGTAEADAAKLQDQIDALRRKK